MLSRCIVIVHKTWCCQRLTILNYWNGVYINARASLHFKIPKCMINCGKNSFNLMDQIEIWWTCLEFVQTITYVGHWNYTDPFKDSLQATTHLYFKEVYFQISTMRPHENLLFLSIVRLPSVVAKHVDFKVHVSYSGLVVCNHPKKKSEIVSSRKLNDLKAICSWQQAAGFESW